MNTKPIDSTYQAMILFGFLASSALNVLIFLTIHTASKTPSGFFLPLAIVVWILFSIFYAWTAFSPALAPALRGKTLLDLGQIQTQKRRLAWCFLLVPFLLVFAAVMMNIRGWNENALEFLASIYGFHMWPLWEYARFLRLSFASTVLTDAGFWTDTELIGWKMIESYHWEPAPEAAQGHRLILFIKLPRAWSFYAPRKTFQIPASQRDAVDKVLAQYWPAPEVGAAVGHCLPDKEKPGTPAREAEQQYE